MERHDKSHECGIEFAVCEVGASAHAGSGAVGVVRYSGAFGVGEVAVNGEGFGVFEVGLVEVGGPGVLFPISFGPV
jgi:hypothetical protein